MAVNQTITHLLRFPAFVLIQGLVLNHVSISGYLNPLLYVMYLLLLPFHMGKQYVLLIAFLLGYCVDLLTGTPGMHAAASVFAAFVRPYLIHALSKRDDDEQETKPVVSSMGVRWVFYFSGIMILIHHFVFFLIETFRISEWMQVLTRTLLSAALTLVVVMLVQFLFFSRSSRSRKPGR